MPGESTGGNLVINTKTFPDDRILGLSLQGGYTTDLTVTRSSLIRWTAISTRSVGTMARAMKTPRCLSYPIFLSSGTVIDSQTGESFALDDYTAGELRRIGAILIKDGFDPDFESATPDAKVGRYLRRFVPAR